MFTIGRSERDPHFGGRFWLKRNDHSFGCAVM
jgi:hypothetical protein